MKSNCVYLLKTEGQGEWKQNAEMRHSLRSLQRHLKDLKGVSVVGGMPTWIKGVFHIQRKDPYTTNKDANLFAKLLAACVSENVEDEFLVMSDDHFFCKDLSIKEIKDSPIWTRNLSQSRIEKSAAGVWEKRLWATKVALEEIGIRPVLCYDSHTPQVVSKKAVLMTASLLSFGQGNGYTVFTAIKNVERHLLKKDITRRNTLKRGVLSRNRNAAYLKENYANWHFMYLDQFAATKQDLQQEIQRIYAQKSRFEK